MPAFADSTSSATGSLQAQLAAIRRRLDALSQLIDGERLLQLQNERARTQLEIASSCLDQAQTVLSQVAESPPDVSAEDSLDWDFCVAEIPSRPSGTVMVKFSPVRAETIPPALDELTD
jgi:hypothetical protein